jgi:hypothetical protein
MCNTRSYPFDFPISPDLMERMRRKTAQIHTWASLPHEPVFSHDNQDAPIGRFQEYKELADHYGLFIGGNRPGLPSLTLMQGRIAYRVHDLAYPSKDETAERRWRVAPRETRIEYNRRDNDFLSLLMKNDWKYGSKNNPKILGRRTISKVDMSLIAHCYQTPVEIWESWGEAQSSPHFADFGVA